MSEKHPTQQHEKREQVASHHEQNHERHEHSKNHEKSTKNETKYSREAIYKAIDKHAVKQEVHTANQEGPHHERPHHYITKTVKRGVYAHTISNVQTHLKPAERRFSKIIHNDTVETLSELGAGTIGRPSAILGGGIFMVFGGLALLLTARYFGFTVPMSMLIALYVTGFVVLFAIDIFSRPIKKRLSRRNQ